MAPKRAKRKRGSVGSLVGLCSDGKLSLIVSTLVEGIAAGETLTPVSRRQIAVDLHDDMKKLIVCNNVELSPAGQYVWKFLEPNRLLAHVIESCPELAEAYVRAANECLPTRDRPWNLLYGYEEFIPGDKLNLQESRKCMVLGYNFEELGEDILCADYSWMLPVVLLSNTLKTILGGWSRLLAIFLRTHLLGAHGLETAGVTVMINGAPLTIFAKTQSITPDYDGIRLGWDWRGASCIRPCLRCANVFKKGSDIARRLEGCQEITCTDKDKLIARTDDDFENDVDLITEAGTAFAAGTITKTVFDKLVFGIGQNFNPLGFPACKTLRFEK